jgi:tight adherence protein C
MDASIFASNGFFLLASALLFCAVVLATVAASGIFAERRQRAQQTGAQSSAQSVTGAPQLAIEDNFLQRFSRFMTPSKEAEHAEMRLRLAQAGYRRPSAVRIFHLSRAVSALVVTVAVAIVFPLAVSEYPLPLFFALIFVAFLVGFIAPSLVLERQIAGRKRVAEEGFPDTLDMLLVCIEAGQGFEQAARRIAKELKGHNEVLAEELTILNDELWAGKDRGTVFRDFSQRLDVNDITAFISVLRQADQFGVSIAEAIRVYASDMRFKRVMRAEEKANTMPLKLALASMAFTVPPTMIIMIGPSLLEIARSFTHT